MGLGAANIYGRKEDAFEWELSRIWHSLAEGRPLFNLKRMCALHFFICCLLIWSRLGRLQAEGLAGIDAPVQGAGSGGCLLKGGAALALGFIGSPLQDWE